MMIIDLAEAMTWDFERFAFDEASRLFRDITSLPTKTILCANDRLAFGVISAAYQAGVNVGHGSDCDIRVAGHDDHPLSRYACPPITTVAQNFNEIGRLSIELLLQKMDETPPSGSIVADRTLLSAEIMLRKSA